jgi:hypothetical protein
MEHAPEPGAGSPEQTAGGRREIVGAGVVEQLHAGRIRERTAEG